MEGNVFPERADIETSSDDYAGRFKGPVGEWFLAVQERVTLSMLDSANPKAVLDVGGGHGQLAGPLCRAGFPVTVHGSDETCGKRISGLVESGKCEFKTGNMLDLPWPDRSFHNVLCFRLLTHCNEWRALVAQLCRVAGHSVIIDYPTSAGLNVVAPVLFGAKKQIEKNTREWKLFKHREIAEEFAKHGFRRARKVGQFFLPMVLHRSMKAPGLSKLLEAICRALFLTRLWGSPVVAEMVREGATGDT
jgi:2-polyprenyl-3-methyl-5-hydroxy-6-metoxy-1,4-benzoquinol methylase